MSDAVHKFFGSGETCELLLEMPGTKPYYCSLTPLHPVHTKACFHCSHALNQSDGDGEEVCRFCKPHFGYELVKDGTVTKPPRCQHCHDGSWHR